MITLGVDINNGFPTGVENIRGSLKFDGGGGLSKGDLNAVPKI